MSDYIKREDALNTIRNTFTGMTADTLELRINDIPTADVAPVRHGKWMCEKDGSDYTYWCSHCGNMRNLRVRWNPIAEEYEYPTHSKYCPNCGAKMDGGNE